MIKITQMHEQYGTSIHLVNTNQQTTRLLTQRSGALREHLSVSGTQTLLGAQLLAQLVHLAIQRHCEEEEKGVSYWYCAVVVHRFFPQKNDKQTNQFSCILVKNNVKQSENPPE
jgi:hypothetical protein